MKRVVFLAMAMLIMLLAGCATRPSESDYALQTQVALQATELAELREALEEEKPVQPTATTPVVVEVTDANGKAEFSDPATGTPVTITVVSTSGDPVPDAEVTYVHGEGFDVFFAKHPEAPLGVGWHTHNSDHTIELAIGLPYHLQEMTPEEAEAAQRYCDAFGYCDEVNYIETISYEEYRQRTVRAGWLVIVETKLLQWLLTGPSLPFVSTLPKWDETEADRLIAHKGQWDVYEWWDAECQCEGGYNYPSQPPTMTGLDVEVDNATATFHWEATDPARYPSGFPDYTIFKAGPTRFSDITFHYGVEAATGEVVSDWETTVENSATIGDLPPGDLTVTAYATDDVDNQSETLSQTFRIAAEEEAAPAPSAPGGWIAFQSNFESKRDRNLDIYKMRPDGSQITRLTQKARSNWCPSWSPDGQWIAFTSDREGLPYVYKMRADGSGITRLTFSEAWDGIARWSPDGQWIAFECYRDDNWEICMMRTDGSEITRLTYNQAEDGYPSCSLDGQWIAFESRRDDGISNIYKMRADGSQVTRLTYGREWYVRPSWSPDGQWIAFECGGDICKMRTDGSAATPLLDGEGRDEYPSWSPDGQWIAFTSDRDGNSEIYIMRADGSRVTRLTFIGGWFPSWGP